MSDREALSIPDFDDDLDDFAPRGGAGQGRAPEPTPTKQPAGRTPSRTSSHTRRAVDAVSHFPSREAPADAQLNLKGPRDVLERFKAMCKADRRSYYDMLRILMDSHEGKGQGG